MNSLSLKMFAENFTTETLEKNIVPILTMLMALFIATFIMLELLCEQKIEDVDDCDEDVEEDEHVEEDEEMEEDEDEEMDEDEGMDEDVEGDEDVEMDEDEEMDEEMEEDEEDEEDEDEEDEETEDEDYTDNEDTEEEDERIPFACKARVNDRIVRHGTFDTTTHTFEFDNGLHAHSPSGACQVILNRGTATNKWQGPSHVYLYINNKWVVFRQTAYY
jgi:hypothetical protein